jgi:hypothetical protein
MARGKGNYYIQESLVSLKYLCGNEGECNILDMQMEFRCGSFLHRLLSLGRSRARWNYNVKIDLKKQILIFV